MGNLTEKETLRQAAEAAAIMIKKLEHAKVKIESKIANLQTVINAWNAVSGKRLTIQDPGQNDSIKRKRIPRGHIEAHIDAILVDGNKYDERTIRELIKERFQVDYGRPSIYSALRRKKKEGKYNNEGGLWSLVSLEINEGEGINIGDQEEDSFIFHNQQ